MESEQWKKSSTYKLLQEMTFMDDFFMQTALADKDAITCVLRVILDKEDLEVVSFQPQNRVLNVNGHSVDYDILAIDEEKRYYNIEIQRVRNGALEKRARYYSAMLDSQALPKQAYYSELAESYVIFIMGTDPFLQGKPLYHVDRVVEELDKPFCDGSHIIFVNGEYRGNDTVGYLMQDFTATSADRCTIRPWPREWPTAKVLKRRTAK